MPLFANPAVMMAFYDPSFRAGVYRPYKWQVDICEQYAQGKLPVQISVACCNGGGKSAVLVAACAGWSAISFDQAQCAVTSSSGAQLDLQSFRSITRFANAMNAYHKAELWQINYRHLEFKPTGSMIDARQSDEEGKMEGMHPLIPGGEFAIFVDEGKSITEEIYAAILRWTGFTRRMDISSAGEPRGTFYKNHISDRWWSRKITVADCPHISQSTIDEIVSTYGPEHAVTRSILWSEFTTTSGSLVLRYETIESLLRLVAANAIEHKKEEDNRAGLDLSGGAAGADEQIMSIWNGNKQIAIEQVHGSSTVDQAEDVIRLTRKYNLHPELRWADAGGAKGVLDVCASRGHPWKRVYNQSRPMGMVAAKTYGNRGTENWMHFARLVEDGAVLLLPDVAQKNQFANRYLQQQTNTGKIIIEPKKITRAHGHPSPDRADAAVLAMHTYTTEAPEGVKAEKRKLMSMEEVEAWYDQLEDEDFSKTPSVGPLTMEDIVGQRKVGGMSDRLLELMK